MSPSKKPDHGPSAMQIPVPEYSDLSVVSHDSQRYPLWLLQHVAQEVSQLLRRQHSEIAVSCAAMKAWLQELDTPLRLAAHPLAAPWQHLPLEQHCAACALWLRQMIERLESAQDGAQSRLRGRILRLRFLDRRQCKAIMLQLNISERHYHRLQNEGLEWLVEQYRLMCSAQPI
jgi:hypothetical protein